jgi:hypothetical protein
MADAAAHIQEVTRQIAAKNKEDMKDENNEFNIRNQFLSNAVNAIREATFAQFNIVICTDQEHDDFQDLQGQILPMDLLNLEISAGKFVNFQVYVFDTGKYLRHGKYEGNYWQFWGNTKKFYDPAAMHVHFDNAQTKRDANAIKAQQDQKAKEDKIAADAAASAKAAQTAAAANETPELKIEAARNAAEAKANANQQPGAVPEVGGGVLPAVGDWGSSDAAASGGKQCVLRYRIVLQMANLEPQELQMQHRVQ